MYKLNTASSFDFKTEMYSDFGDENDLEETVFLCGVNLVRTIGLKNGREQSIHRPFEKIRFANPHPIQIFNFCFNFNNMH